MLSSFGILHLKKFTPPIVPVTITKTLHVTFEILFRFQIVRPVKNILQTKIHNKVMLSIIILCNTNTAQTVFRKFFIQFQKCD